MYERHTRKAIIAEEDKVQFIQLFWVDTSFDQAELLLLYQKCCKVLLWASCLPQSQYLAGYMFLTLSLCLQENIPWALRDYIHTCLHVVFLLVYRSYMLKGWWPRFDLSLSTLCKAKYCALHSFILFCRSKLHKYMCLSRKNHKKGTSPHDFL